ncbi:hypothetical protein MJG53_000847 [Ovis ammon polii x Ovis aries]|uniref:Uncharacterized protein n=1 Tax=Ovis ammon polii x Ovis aries TaxID=2918886 RepID=A0ACB9VJ73_9CETA|nr:hypothetical protein MJT46_000338 [Ovis ammon polii x Ovis aries]KAI4589798.1 hypothetical protein MJG53_000847 [Ovis ammon polii x Ovis aries]
MGNEKRQETVVILGKKKLKKCGQTSILLQCGLNSLAITLHKALKHMFSSLHPQQPSGRGANVHGICECSGQNEINDNTLTPCLLLPSVREPGRLSTLAGVRKGLALPERVNGASPGPPPSPTRPGFQMTGGVGGTAVNSERTMYPALGNRALPSSEYLGNTSSRRAAHAGEHGRAHSAHYRNSRSAQPASPRNFQRPPRNFSQLHHGCPPPLPPL